MYWLFSCFSLRLATFLYALVNNVCIFLNLYILIVIFFCWLILLLNNVSFIYVDIYSSHQLIFNCPLVFKRIHLSQCIYPVGGSVVFVMCVFVCVLCHEHSCTCVRRLKDMNLWGNWWAVGIFIHIHQSNCIPERCWTRSTSLSESTLFCVVAVLVLLDLYIFCKIWWVNGIVAWCLILITVAVGRLSCT